MRKFAQSSVPCLECQAHGAKILEARKADAAKGIITNGFLACVSKDVSIDSVHVAANGDLKIRDVFCPRQPTTLVSSLVGITIILIMRLIVFNTLSYRDQARVYIRTDINKRLKNSNKQAGSWSSPTRPASTPLSSTTMTVASGSSTCLLTTAAGLASLPAS